MSVSFWCLTGIWVGHFQVWWKCHCAHGRNTVRLRQGTTFSGFMGVRREHRVFVFYHLCSSLRFQHLLANGKSRLGWPGVSRDPAPDKWLGVCADMCMLWSHLLCNQRPQLSRSSLWHHRGQTDGPPCVHRLCLLGSYCILRSDSCSRVSPDWCSTHQNPPGILLPTQLLCQPVPICSADEAIQARPLHPFQQTRNLYKEGSKVQRGRCWFLELQLGPTELQSHLHRRVRHWCLHTCSHRRDEHHAPEISRSACPLWLICWNCRTQRVTASSPKQHNAAQPELRAWDDPEESTWPFGCWSQTSLLWTTRWLPLVKCVRNYYVMKKNWSLTTFRVAGLYGNCRRQTISVYFVSAVDNSLHIFQLCWHSFRIKYFSKYIGEFGRRLYGAIEQFRECRER